MSGFITMNRDALEHPLLRDGDRFRAWFWLIANACWKPTKVSIKGTIVELQRGELSFSQRFLAEKWGWSKSRVDRFIAELRDQSMIETRSKIGATEGHNAGQGQCIISICNYAQYQDQGQTARGNDYDDAGATAGQQRGNSGAKKNKGTREQVLEEEEPNGSPSSARAPAKLKSPHPELPEWVPSEAWDAFAEMRRRKGKGARLTDRAVTLLIGKLEDLRRHGHDPGAVLDQSTLNQWTDVYALKDNRNGSQNDWGSTASPYSGRDTRDGFARALDRRIHRDQPEQPPSPARRPDAGDGGSDGFLPLAAPRALP